MFEVRRAGAGAAQPAMWMEEPEDREGRWIDPQPGHPNLTVPACHYAGARTAQSGLRSSQSCPLKNLPDSVRLKLKPNALRAGLSLRRDGTETLLGRGRSVSDRRLLELPFCGVQCRRHR